MRFLLLPILFLLPLLLSGKAHPQDAAPAPEPPVVLNGIDRVVALGPIYAEDLLALRLTPVGVAELDSYRRENRAGADRLTNAVDVGPRLEPDLGAVAALAPDLIVGSIPGHARLYGRLAEIAPTLLFDPRPGPGDMSRYQERVSTFRTLAVVLGRIDQADAHLAHLESFFGQARAALEAAGLAGTRVIVVRILPDPPRVAVMAPNAFPSLMLEKAGLVNAWPGGFDDDGFQTVGIEALAAVADATLLYAADADDPAIHALITGPAWQGLPMLQAGKALPLPEDITLSPGILSAEPFTRQTLATLGAPLL